MPNLPNFHDSPDGSLSINHTGEDFWVGIDMDEMSFSAEPTPVTPPTLTLEEAFRRHAAALPPPLPATIRPAPPQPPPQTATQVNEAQRTVRVYSQGSSPFRVSAAEADCPPSLAPYPPEPFVQPERRPQTATEVDEAQRRARINPAWRTATYEMDGTPVSRSQVEELAANIEAPRPSPPRRQRPNRRVSSDPDAAIRKDPNAWSMREAVELCKLLEVVLPEAGFHIALTGGLLHKEGRQHTCDLLFYQVRGAEPNYEVLWKYLTVAGVIRSPSYPENGWLVKATYRGKAVDCLFPNAKKVKKAGAANPDCYKAAPPTPPTPDMEPPMNATEVNVYQQGVRAAEREIERRTGIGPILYRRSPSAPLQYDPPAPYDPAELDRAVAAAREADRELERRTGIIDPTAEGRRRMAVCEDCAVPGDFENPAAIPEPPF